MLKEIEFFFIKSLKGEEYWICLGNLKHKNVLIKPYSKTEIYLIDGYNKFNKKLKSSIENLGLIWKHF